MTPHIVLTGYNHFDITLAASADSLKANKVLRNEEGAMMMTWMVEGVEME